MRRSRERGERLALTIGIGLAAATLAIVQGDARPRPSDFSPVWAAARFLFDGANPYDAIGPDRAFAFDFLLLYPLTAAVVALPLAWLPAMAAESVFMGLSAAALAWALTREKTTNPQLFVFTSHAFLFALSNVQWSPLLCAAALLPSLGALLACKPTLALAFLAAYPSRRAALLAAFFTLLTVLLWPWWIPAWLAALSTATHIVAPITLWGGPLVLLSLLKWRRPEARLLVALACVPHTPAPYEAIPLFLVVRRWWEGILLSALTPLVWYLGSHGGPYPTYEAWTSARGQWQLWLLYLPCVAMILCRPNVGLISVGWPRRTSPTRDRAVEASAGLPASG